MHGLLFIIVTVPSSHVLLPENFQRTLRPETTRSTPPALDTSCCDVPQHVRDMTQQCRCRPRVSGDLTEHIVTQHIFLRLF